MLIVLLQHIRFLTKRGLSRFLQRIITKCIIQSTQGNKYLKARKHMLNQDKQRPIPQNTFKYLCFITIFFSATWLISCIAAVKIILVFGFTFTGGFIIFPFTSLISSLIVEVYGYKNVRQAIWSGFLLNVLFVFFIFVVGCI